MAIRRGMRPGHPRKPKGTGRDYGYPLSVRLDAASEAGLETLRRLWRPDDVHLLSKAQAIQMALAGTAIREAPEDYATELERIVKEREAK